MTRLARLTDDTTPADALQAYLLGAVPVHSIYTLMRRLAYEVSGCRSSGVLILCEHPPSASIGRSGSLGQLAIDPVEGPVAVRKRGWAIDWVAHGGRTMIHLPGQLAIYPVVALDYCGLSPARYLQRLHAVVREVLAQVAPAIELQSDDFGMLVSGRRLIAQGIAVRSGVASWGMTLNVNPDLESLAELRLPGDDAPMTSLERETRSPLRRAALRQKFVESFASMFGFSRTTVFHHHPLLTLGTYADAIADRTG